jgi:hypothetical protein
VSATLYQDPATDNDNAFYALSSDAYWSNDESVSHRLAELGADGHGGELASTTTGSDATSAAGFDSSHFTFNDSTSAVFSTCGAVVRGGSLQRANRHDHRRSAGIASVRSTTGTDVGG